MRVLLTCALFLLAAPLFAALGTVSYVAVPGAVRMNVQPGMFTKPGNETGLVSPIARVASVPFQDGKWAVALDADTSQGTQFTCVRLDFTGAGHFTPENVLELRQQPGRTDGYTVSEPKDFAIQVGSRTLSVSITGFYLATNHQPNLWLSLGCAVQADCAFGDKTYTVRIEDSNGNWHFGDPNPIPSFPIRGGVGTGDYLWVGASSGWYGQPIEIDGHWYRVAITPDESTITVTPFTEPMGAIAVNAERWNGTFIGAKYLVNISNGTAQPQSIPADNYHLVSFHQLPDQSGKPPLTISDFAGTGKVYAVKADATVPVTLGPSITARVQVQQNGRNLTFYLRAANAAGVPFTLLGNNVPFVVTDQQGNRVYQNTFENG